MLPSPPSPHPPPPVEILFNSGKRFLGTSITRTIPVIKYMYFTRKLINIFQIVFVYNMVLLFSKMFTDFRFSPKCPFQLFVSFQFPVFRSQSFHSSVKLVLSTRRLPRLPIRHPRYPCQPLRNLSQGRLDFPALR